MTELFENVWVESEVAEMLTKEWAREDEFFSGDFGPEEAY